VLALFRQRLYQIIAGYEDANDADRLRHDPVFRFWPINPWVNLWDRGNSTPEKRYTETIGSRLEVLGLRGEVADCGD